MSSERRGRVLWYGAALLLLVSRPTALAEVSRNTASWPQRCRTRASLGILVSPAHAIVGQPLRVLIVADDPHPAARLLSRSPSGLQQLQVTPRGGPPYWWLAELAAPRPGTHRFALVDARGQALACRRVRVRRRRSAVGTESEAGWPIEAQWTRRSENLYSAWVEQLFDAPIDQRPSWRPLHAVLRDPARNLLYNHLGSAEDGPDPRRAVVVEPDCADFPYFIRAYFAWKLRLPFGYRHCDRGTAKRASRCRELRTTAGHFPPEQALAPARAFSRFLRRRLSYVHSGSGRTAADDDQTDLYPVALSRDTLRPGSVYVDPFGHLLVVAKWTPQTAGVSGSMYAIDGHPDLSVGRKRFWRGAFLFSATLAGGGGGFKVFRPLAVRDQAIVPLTNEELRASREFHDPSTQQYRLGTDGFYEQMDRVINPQPLSPGAAYRARLAAYYELLEERIDAVAAGERYMKETSYQVMAMPTGPRIFETRGPWEDFSTPARDMRLLIATDEVLGFPQRVVRHPDRFAIATGRTPVDAKRDLERQFREFAKRHQITYVKSDGTSVTITVADIVARRQRLEVAYNPNDCVELRWGASGKELATCERRAPADQQQLMRSYRPWFASRDRPPIR